MNPKERQAVIFAAFGGVCVYCHREVFIPLARERKISPRRAVIDHGTPLCAGGSDTFENAALACNDCNLSKHDGAAP
jgi:5-methylcytosine-specific restriction endonuclease McrA